MANKTITQGNAFKLAMQFKAICNSNDFKSPWRSTEDEAINDALEHQNLHANHKLEIIHRLTQEYRVELTNEKLLNYTKNNK